MKKPRLEHRLAKALRGLNDMLDKQNLSQCRQSTVRMTTNPKTGEKIVSRIVQEPKP